MLWFFEKLRSLVAWAIFQTFAWLVVPGVALFLCIFRVRLPEYPFDGQSCRDQVDDAGKTQDEMSGVRR